MIEKYLRDCVGLVEDIRNSDSAVIVNSKNIAIDCEMKFADRRVSLKHVAVQVAGFDVFSFLNDARCRMLIGKHEFVVEKENIIETSHQMSLDKDRFCEVIQVQVACFCSVNYSEDKLCYYRLMVPQSGKSWSRRDVECVWYNDMMGTHSDGLISIQVPDKGEVHIYPSKNGNLVVVDILFPCNKKEAFDLFYNASVTMSLLTKTILLDCIWAFAYDDPVMKNEFEFCFQTMAESVTGQYDIFVNNIYSVEDFLKKHGNDDIKYACDQFTMQNAIGKIVTDYSFIEPLKSAFLTNYFNMIYSNADLQRATAIICEASKFSLEYEGAMFALALETITSALNISGPLPVEKEIYNNIVEHIKQITAQFRERGEISVDAERILNGRLNTWNQPTNKDKLSVPFNHFGYNLHKYEEKALEARNKFMHGKLPYKLTSNFDKDYKNLWDICIILHKLCVILLLKNAGYNGFIYNNCIAYKVKGAIDSKEPIFLII